MSSLSEYSFHLIQGSISAELGAEVVKIWTESGGLGQVEAQRRLAELVLVLKNESGKIVGVSTAAKTYLEQIQNYVYGYRCFILPAYRAPALDTKMLVIVKDHLQQISLNETDEKCVGIMLIVQNEILKKNWRQAVWLGADMIYVGNTPKGNHIRLGYFKNARI